MGQVGDPHHPEHQGETAGHQEDDPGQRQPVQGLGYGTAAPSGLPSAPSTTGLGHLLPALPCRNPACSTNQARGRSQYACGRGIHPFIIIRRNDGRRGPSTKTGRAWQPGDGQRATPPSAGSSPRLGGTPQRHARPVSRSAAGLLLPGPLSRSGDSRRSSSLISALSSRTAAGRHAARSWAWARLSCAAAQLLAQLGVLLGQPPLRGPDAGQLLLQASHGPGERDIAVRAPRQARRPPRAPGPALPAARPSRCTTSQRQPPRQLSRSRNPRRLPHRPSPRFAPRLPAVGRTALRHRTGPGRCPGPRPG